MTQTFLFYMGPDDQLGYMAQRLQTEGFKVGPSGRMVAGIHVRVRTGTADEATVEQIASEVAPAAKRGPAGSPTTHLANYRDGQP